MPEAFNTDVRLPTLLTNIHLISNGGTAMLQGAVFSSALRISGEGSGKT